jgi:hypothetical protein
MGWNILQLIQEVLTMELSENLIVATKAVGGQIMEEMEQLYLLLISILQVIYSLQDIVRVLLLVSTREEELG